MTHQTDCTCTGEVCQYAGADDVFKILGGEKAVEEERQSDKSDLAPLWTEEERLTLLKSIRKENVDWEKIAEDLKPRTINACKG